MVITARDAMRKLDTSRRSVSVRPSPVALLYFNCRNTAEDIRLFVLVDPSFWFLEPIGRYKILKGTLDISAKQTGYEKFASFLYQYPTVSWKRGRIVTDSYCGASIV